MIHQLMKLFGLTVALALVEKRAFLLINYRGLLAPFLFTINFKNMKKVSIAIVALCLLSSCKDKQNQKGIQPQFENTVLVIVTDNSISFARHAPKITGDLLKPLCDKISTTGNLDVRVGQVITNSDTQFLRYSQQKSKVQEESSNPWIDAGHEEPEKEPQSQWEVFTTSLSQQTSQKPAPKSDIGGALAHALLIFQEYPSNTRKILCIATDYKNNGLPIPSISPNIEVINIGALSNVPIEKILNTQNVKRFESVQTAFEFISSTY